MTLHEEMSWAEMEIELERHYGEESDTKSALRATPFTWPDPAAIPPREWLLGRWLLRGEVTAVIAPGGVGKSTFVSAFALSIASGQEFLGKTAWEGARRVWVWNLEDDRQEIERSVVACGQHHGVGPMDCADRLYVDSGLDQELCTAIEGENGFQIVEPVYEALKSEIERRGIDVLTIDPFVSSHAIDENANALIDKVAKRWKRLAHETRCSIVLVHHTKKTGGREITAEDGRGAIALINAARITLVMNPMSADEAERFGIKDQVERRSYVRIDDGKPNRAPPEKAWWMKKESVALGNGDDHGRSDDVGAAAAWTPPNAFDGLCTRDLYNVQLAIDAGEYGDSAGASDWAGHAVADTLGFDLDDKTDSERVKSLLREWKKNKAFKVEKRSTKKGRDRPFLVVDKWVDPATLPTSKTGVGTSGESGVCATPETSPHPTPPLGGGGGGGGVDPRDANFKVGK